jgi:shikimate dehydrogenase
MSGAVIATGGGCVTKKENYPLLRRNGTIVWLRRDLNLLARTGRPLSQRDGAAALYESRKELYESFADFVVDNNGDVITTAKKITEIFE